MLDAAWRGLTAGDRITADTLLGAVAGNLVTAIDEWESARSTQ